MSTSKEHSTKSSAAHSIAASAQKAVDLITEAQANLPLENGPLLKALKAANGLQHVSAEAISEAASIVEANPARYPAFDATTAREAVAYMAAADLVVNRASSLIARVQASTLQHHVAAAEQTLGLFTVLKGHSRTDGSVVADLRRLSPLLNTRKNPHQTKVQREKAQAKSAVATPATASVGAASPATSETPASPANPATSVAPLTNGASAPATSHS